MFTFQNNPGGQIPYKRFTDRWLQLGFDQSDWSSTHHTHTYVHNNTTIPCCAAVKLTECQTDRERARPILRYFLPCNAYRSLTDLVESLAPCAALSLSSPSLCLSVCLSTYRSISGSQVQYLHCTHTRRGEQKGVLGKHRCVCVFVGGR